MSIDHNRIKIADLEKNLPNKILTTNNNGELEFSDSYNDLDCTVAGKVLDARQGKVLKDLVDNINTLLLSDNINLDTVQELVDAIETVQTSLSTILVNDLTTGGATKALTAEMGKLLQNTKVDKVTGKSLLSDTEITRLGSLSNYTHPVNHPPSIITQDTNNRFVTDAEKATWNAKQSSLGFTAENAANKNVASGYAGLGADGKLISSQLPSITISNTFVTASQASMLAVAAETGDIAVRTDLNKSFILKGTNSTVLADWQELLTPTSAVTTVFGRSGAVAAQTGDYTADQITETATKKFQSANQQVFNDATSSIQTQLNSKQPSGTYATGTGSATGINTGDNAINSLYSGLVSNATHTGDATGSTALTVKGINGTLLSGLATGILKNTTTTGVPVIAAVRTDYAEPTTALATGILKNTTTTGAHTIAVASDFPILNQNTTGTAGTITGSIAESQVTNLVTDLAGKEPSISKNTAFNKNFGTSTGTIAEGNDSRILNGQSAYGWGNHAGLYRAIGYVPSWNEITSKPTTLSGFGITDALSASTTHYIGTTNLAFNRASAAQTLTGISIDGNAGTSYSASNLMGSINASGADPSTIKINDTRYWVNAPNAPGNYFQCLTLGNGSDYTQIGVDSSQKLSFRFNGGTWNNVLHNNNYNSYSPTLTGVGASGTWSIGISGNAGTVGGLAVHSATNNEANKIVRTDSNGYIHAGWINTVSGNNGTTAIDRIYASNDQYLRYYTPENFISVLGLAKVATNRWYDGWVTSPGYDANTIGGSKSGFTYTNNAPLNGALINFDAGGYGLQLNSNYGSGVCDVRFRSRNGDNATWGSWGQFVTNGNIGSQSVNYANSSNLSNKLNPLSGDSNYKLAYTADGQRTNAGEWGRAVMRYEPNGQTYGIRVDRADYADSAGSATSATSATTATYVSTSGSTQDIELPLMSSSVTSGNTIPIVKSTATLNPSTSILTAAGFKKSGGTNTQYLMADGSVGTGNSAWDAGKSFNPTGYQKYSNGLIIQWGAGTTSANHNTKINFPIAFASYCCSVQITLNNLSGGSPTSVPYMEQSGVKYSTTTGFYGGTPGVGQTWTWIAIGY